MTSSLPIAVFDSGLGGLTVVKALQEEMPNENFIYYADNAFVPYGEKSEDEIKQRCFEVTEHLLSQGAKAIVVACNTATAATITELRERYDVPFFGTEPAIKPAAQQSQLGIAVLATRSTLASQQFKNLLERFVDDQKVHSIPAPNLVNMVEAGQWQGEIVAKELNRLLNEVEFDTLILGCTHYSFLKEQIKNMLPKSVTVIDSAEPIAKWVRLKLEAESMLVNKDVTEAGQGRLAVECSGDAESLKLSCTRNYLPFVLVSGDVESF